MRPTDQGRGGGGEPGGGGGATTLGAADPAAGGGDGGGATLAAGGAGGGAAANVGGGERRPFLPPLSSTALSCIPVWPMACTSMIRPSGVTRPLPCALMLCPGVRSAAKRSASGGGKRRVVPSSRMAPFTSPRLP